MRLGPWAGAVIVTGALLITGCASGPRLGPPLDTA